MTGLAYGWVLGIGWRSVYRIGLLPKVFTLLVWSRSLAFEGGTYILKASNRRTDDMIVRY